MNVTNALAYYNTATIMAVKGLTVLAPVTVSEGLLKNSILTLPKSIRLVLDVNDCDKCSSLLQYINNYACKRFNSIGPGDSVSRHTLTLNLSLAQKY